MTMFFCTTASAQLGEELIGTAGHYQSYVLIECPQPWAADALESKHFPAALRRFIKAIQAERSVQFLCIDRGQSAPISRPTVLIYERQLTDRFTSGFSHRYRGYEFQLTDLEQVVGCLQAHWQGDRLGHPSQSKIRNKTDILVCTHGMRDKCCARFGRPFLRAAQQHMRQAPVPNVRFWQVSHIGGHRFAPTAITLPDGRYYGRLTATALHAILTRSGPISQMLPVYRGWGLLPKPLQVLEQYLLLRQGWSWLAQSVAYRILSEGTDGSIGTSQIQAKLSTESPDGLLTTYRAKLMVDPQQTRCLKGSCSAAQPSTFVKYTVADCSVVETILPEIQPPNRVSVA